MGSSFSSFWGLRVFGSSFYRSLFSRHPFLLEHGTINVTLSAKKIMVDVLYIILNTLRSETKIHTIYNPKCDCYELEVNYVLI